MSYLKQLVNNAKKTNGYSGRQGDKYARLERKRTKSSGGDSVETPGNSSWYLWVGLGTFVVVGGIYFYRRNRSNSSNPNTATKNQDKTTKPADPELEQLKKVNTELRRRPNPEKKENKNDLDEFIDRIPDDQVKDKGGMLDG